MPVAPEEGVTIIRIFLRIISHLCSALGLVVTTAGCSNHFGTESPPAGPGTYIGGIPYPASEATFPPSTGCGAPAVYTQLRKWQDAFQTSSGQIVYRPAASTYYYWSTNSQFSGTLPIGDYYLQGQTPFTTAVSQAINTWSIDLQANVESGYTFNLVPVEQDDPTALVQYFSTVAGNYGILALTSFGLYNGYINNSPQDQIKSGTIAAAFVQINSDSFTPNNLASAPYVWSVMTHELGHAMGLDHNPYPGSIMYPTMDDAGNGCWQNISDVPVADTGVHSISNTLEGEYDPRQAVPKGNGNKCGKNVCLADPAKLAAMREFVSGTSPAAHSARDRLLRSLSWVHGQSDFAYSRLSASSVLISSPLVAVVRVGPLVNTVQDTSPGLVMIHSATIAKVYHSVAGDKVGDSILIGDRAAYATTGFFDDPQLVEGQTALVLLRPEPSSAVVRLAAARSRLYEPTTAVLSKFVFDSRGGLRPMSPAPARAFDELRGISLDQFMSRATQRSQLSYNLSNVGRLDPFTSLAAARGLSPTQYAILLGSDPGRLLYQNYWYDRAHSSLPTRYQRP